MGNSVVRFKNDSYLLSHYDPKRISTKYNPNAIMPGDVCLVHLVTGESIYAYVKPFGFVAYLYLDSGFLYPSTPSTIHPTRCIRVKNENQLEEIKKKLKMQTRIAEKYMETQFGVQAKIAEEHTTVTPIIVVDDRPDA